jgi:hypothetical protein
VAGLFFMVSPSVAASLAAEGLHARPDLLRTARSGTLIIAAVLGPTMLFFLVGGRYIMIVFGAS